MAYWDFNRIDQIGTAVDLANTGTVEWGVGAPVDVKRLIFVTTTAHTVANATITVAIRNRDNTGSVTKGTFVLPFTGSVLNQVQQVITDKSDGAGVTSSIDGSLVFTAGEGVLELGPGQELSITSDGGGTAGAYDVYVEYQVLGFSGPRVANVIERAFVSA